MRPPSRIRLGCMKIHSNLVANWFSIRLTLHTCTVLSANRLKCSSFCDLVWPAVAGVVGTAFLHCNRSWFCCVSTVIVDSAISADCCCAVEKNNKQFRFPLQSTRISCSRLSPSRPCTFSKFSRTKYSNSTQCEKQKKGAIANGKLTWCWARRELFAFDFVDAPVDLLMNLRTVVDWLTARATA